MEVVINKAAGTRAECRYQSLSDSSTRDHFAFSFWHTHPLATLTIPGVSTVIFDDATTALAVTFSFVRNARWAGLIFRITFTTLGTGFVRAYVVPAF
jgi:hypothetical protein